MSPDAQRGPEPTVADRTGARALTGWWFFALHLWTVWALALSNGFLGLAVVSSGWTGRWSRVPWRSVRGLVIPGVLYALFVLVSTALSHDPEFSMQSTRGLLSLLTLILALGMVQGEGEVRRVVDGLVMIGAILALYGLGQTLFGFGDINHRIPGPFSHYMTFAGVLLLADQLLIAQMICARGWKSAWRWGALVAINLALLISLTRSAWVALVLTLTVLLLMRVPRAILAYVPAALLFLIIAPVPVVHRVISIADLDDTSNYDRICMVEAGVHMVRERPFFGIGPGMVGQRYPLYRNPTSPRIHVPHLHNTYVQMAAEEGLPALGAYLWLVVGSMVLAFRGYRREIASGGSRADLFMGAFLGVLAFSLAGMFEDNWGDTEVKRIAMFAMAIPYCLLPRPDDAAPGVEAQES